MEVENMESMEVLENGSNWILPDDLPEKINYYIMDFIELDLQKTPDDLRAGSPLLFSSLCIYVGSRLRMLSPLFNNKNIRWYNAPGACEYFHAVLPLFLSTCFLYDKIPHSLDFWRFSGLAPGEYLNNYLVGGGFIPGWLSDLLKLLKESEKGGLESVLVDKKYNINGVSMILQYKHGYALTDPLGAMGSPLISADSLPDFRQYAQTDHNDEKTENA